ncbi:ATP-dependent DNA helicase RecG [Georgenia subflava]|uniref:Probable DNA 3'-5' helicase RecG n=1 Tax=Georgenia subflava TaxID=1622177 RepID=A0A6N7EE01_9MICO|nr:ATP-dependent DNA helicase RecG [Georgenia subflava]MPV36240.1 DEAD/DEAH box helicase [Georgenia subflava]
MNEQIARGTRHDPAFANIGKGRLDQSLEKELGPKTGKALGKLGLRTVEDLLRHYPRRYGDRGRLTALAELRTGEHVTVIARVAGNDLRAMRNRSGAILTVRITDGTEELTLTFFGKHRGSLEYHERRLRPGATGMFTGTVSLYRGARQLTHPDYDTFDDLDDEFEAVQKVDWPIPIYPASSAIASWRIGKAVQTLMATIEASDVPEALPAAYRKEHRLPDVLTALRRVHEPHSPEDWRGAHKRFRHEEAFVLQTALAQRRAVSLAEATTARPPRAGGVRDAFDARLPFELTAGQQEVAAVLERELATSVPMMRLLQGEVGSGKTVVAVRGMLQVVDAGGQAALLAPTEVLAQQHYRSITDLLGPLAEAGMLGGAEHATRVVLLTGSMSAAARRKALALAASGAAGIVIGTHALLSEIVQIPDLGLVVVDEQHRFGVEQRDALRAKGRTTPHLLVMTATPIPRTVAMTSFGDLETSTLRELPAGRAGITTTIVPANKPHWVGRTWERVREEIDSGGRAYVVCPRITAGEDAGAAEDGFSDDVTAELFGLEDERAPRRPLASVEEVSALLRETPALDGVAIGQMHGQLPTEAKDAAMADFASGRTPVLVSTTVIEVGVDVPEATVMVILDADRFGLSQLHQLRGRIGRGTRPGLCLAVTAADPATPTGERLLAFAATTDGFELAETDLRLRREGDVLGASQSGRSSSLRLLRVLTDAPIIEAARSAARDLVARDPELTTEPGLAQMVAESIDEDAAAYLERT